VIGLILSVDFLSEIAIYTQLHDQIVIGIASGALKPGEDLPSVRRLAADIGINIHTVNKTYALLRDEGYVVMDRRSGAAIADGPPDNRGFSDHLARLLRPIAAEAACHGQDAAAFSGFCWDIFLQVKGSGREPVDLTGFAGHDGIKSGGSPNE
jgi:GntR family transcriptional regulator